MESNPYRLISRNMLIGVKLSKFSRSEVFFPGDDGENEQLRRRWLDLNA